MYISFQAKSLQTYWTQNNKILSWVAPTEINRSAAGDDQVLWFQLAEWWPLYIVGLFHQGILIYRQNKIFHLKKIEGNELGGGNENIGELVDTNNILYCFKNEYKYENKQKIATQWGIQLLLNPSSKIMFIGTRTKAEKNCRRENLRT